MISRAKVMIMTFQGLTNMQRRSHLLDYIPSSMSLWIQTWEAYVMASSCRAESQPLSIVSSGRESLYHTLGGLTLERELVSTTGSGCRSPIFTRGNKKNINKSLLKDKQATYSEWSLKPIHLQLCVQYSVQLNVWFSCFYRWLLRTFHWHIFGVRFCVS